MAHTLALILPFAVFYAAIKIYWWARARTGDTPEPPDAPENPAPVQHTGYVLNGQAGDQSGHGPGESRSMPMITPAPMQAPQPMQAPVPMQILGSDADQLQEPPSPEPAAEMPGQLAKSVGAVKDYLNRFRKNEGE